MPEPTGINAHLITALDKVIAAQNELIAYYQTDHERSMYDTADLPEDLLKLEEAVTDAAIYARFISEACKKGSQ